MSSFHKDNINWGNFSIRETLFDTSHDPKYLAGLSADDFFNMPVTEQEARFNQQGNHPVKHEYHREKHSWIVNLVHKLCRKSHIPMLSVVMFKTNHVGASTFPGTEIDITKGAIDKLSKPQLEAVIAHEVAHNIIKQKKIHTKNTETSADIIGAKLSSEQGMISVIKYFAKHVTKETDSEHYSDKKRISEIKSAFKVINRKIKVIKKLQEKANHLKLKNKKLSRLTKQKKIRHYKTKIHQARQINKNLKQLIKKRHQRQLNNFNRK